MNDVVCFPKLAPVHSILPLLPKLKIRTPWSMALRRDSLLVHNRNPTLINTWSLCCGSVQNATPRRRVCSSRPEWLFICRYWNQKPGTEMSSASLPTVVSKFKYAISQIFRSRKGVYKSSLVSFFIAYNSTSIAKIFKNALYECLASKKHQEAYYGLALSELGMTLS
jgi:hypothetical protein